MNDLSGRLHLTAPRTPRRWTPLLTAGAMCVAMIVVASGSRVVPAQATAGVPMRTGDLLVDGGLGLVRHYDANASTVLDSLNDGSCPDLSTCGASSDSLHGNCIDTSGRYFRHETGTHEMTVWRSGVMISSNWANDPHISGLHEQGSCVTDANGHVYIVFSSLQSTHDGQVRVNDELVEFDPSGAWVKTHEVWFNGALCAGCYNGSDEIVGIYDMDLAADACTLVYVPGDRTVRRWDLCDDGPSGTDGSRPDLASNVNADLPPPSGGNPDKRVCGSQHGGLRIRPDGSVIVRCLEDILELASSGATLHEYPIPTWGGCCSGEGPLGMALDPTGRWLWLDGSYVVEAGGAPCGCGPGGMGTGDDVVLFKIDLVAESAFTGCSSSPNSGFCTPVSVTHWPNPQITPDFNEGHFYGGVNICGEYRSTVAPT